MTMMKSGGKPPPIQPSSYFPTPFVMLCRKKRSSKLAVNRSFCAPSLSPGVGFISLYLRSSQLCFVARQDAAGVAIFAAIMAPLFY